MSNARALRMVAVFVLAIAAAVACGDERSAFVPNPSFDLDAGADGDAPECRLQCSFDGRTVIRACTGEVVETCPPNLACGEARCQPPCSAAAADHRSDGCEFYFQTPPFSKLFPQSCFAVYVVNTSAQPAELELELEGSVLDISRSLYRTTPGDPTLIPLSGPLASGESAILFVSDLTPGAPAPGEDRAPCAEGIVPASYSDKVPSGTGLGSGFHMTSNVPVGVTSIYPFGGARSYIPSATLLLPVTTWTTQHIVVNGWEASRTGVPTTQIFAREDDTEVTILPKRDIQDGPGVIGAVANTSASYRLAKGQFLQFAQTEELSGSVVSSNKPTTIFGGHSCALIPVTGGNCDTLNEQIPGFDHWGSTYVGVGYRPRLGNEHELLAYRIVAARDGTELDYDPVAPPGAPLTMSAGEVAMFARGTGDAFVVRTQDADHPIYMAAHMSGMAQGIDGHSSYGGRGDPEFVSVVPAGQYLSSYSFYADPTYGNTSLVVVRARSGERFEDVWLECAGNLTGFRPVGTRGEFEWVRVDLGHDGAPGAKFGDRVCQTGLHRMRSNGPFTATLWGWDERASYAYPGGMAQRKLVLSPLPPIR